MFDPRDPAYHQADRFMGIGYVADAAVHGGHRELARAKLRELEALNQVTGSPALRLGIAYARPVLAADEEAEGLYQVTLDELGGWPFMRARLQLAYGVWLRRQRRIAESRAPLRAALGTLEALGARGWRARAAGARRLGPVRARAGAVCVRSADAAGVADRADGRRRAVEPRDRPAAVPLPTDRRDASVPVFPKLAITSRSQLRVALSAAGTPAMRATVGAARGSDAV